MNEYAQRPNQDVLLYKLQHHSNQLFFLSTVCSRDKFICHEDDLII